MSKKVAVIMGSDSDFPVVKGCIKTLKSFGIETEVRVLSAHRTPAEAAAFADSRLSHFACPICGEEMKGAKWVNQGDQRHMNVFSCPDHGSYLTRARFRRSLDFNNWGLNLLVYEADAEMLDFYKAKSAIARRRGRGHSKRKNRPAK